MSQTGGVPPDEPPRRSAADLSTDRRELLARLVAERRAQGAVAPAERAALSPAQERFWFLEQLEPGNPAHHVAGRLQLHGDLDLAALQRSARRLVARHAGLRSTFENRAGAPRCVQRDHVQVPLPLVDLRGLAGDAAAAARAAETAAVVAPPFDLQRGPLLRQVLLRTATDRHELIWCLHHIIVDGLSMALLAHEFALLYAGETGGAPTSLPQLPDYREHAATQREWLTSARCRALEDQWLEHLRGLPELDFADSGRGPDPVAAATGDRRTLTLSAQEAARFAAAAQHHSLTSFQWYVTGFAALLHRLTGAVDFAIGTPTAGRPPRFRSVVGCFVNSLALRIDGSGRPSFGDLARRVRDECRWAYARQEMPFERLVERLAPERHPHRHPVFQVLCNHVDFAPPERFADLRQRYEELPAGTLLDLTLYVRRAGAEVRLEFEFDARRHDGETLRGWLIALRELLLSAADDGQTAVADLHLLDATTTAELLRRGGARPTPTPLAATVHELVLRSCAARGHATAVRAGAAELSYAALAQRAERWRASLAAAGVAGGHRVVVALPRDLELVPALLGVMACGAAWVPIDPQHPAARTQRILDDAAPQWRLGSLPAGVTATATPLPPAPSAREPAARAPAAPAVTPAAPAYVLYTSGSTGAPKGVLVPHRAVVAFLAALPEEVGLRSGDTVLAITTLGFDIAVLELFAPLVLGGTVCLAPAAIAGDPAALAAALADQRVDVLQATPTTWRLLQAHGLPSRSGSAPLRALVGGEPLPADLAAWLAANCRTVHNLYGPTETTVWSSTWRVPEDFAATAAVRIGRPLPGTFFRVLDASGRLLPPGSAGELAIGGGGVSLGYLGDQARTAARFVDDPLGGGTIYRTGDRARCDADGTYVHLGRIDAQLKVRGHRVEPGEIESLLREHPGVADAAVDLRDGMLCAWIVASDTADAQIARAASARWRDVWQATYADGDESAGWNDTVTGAPLSPATLRAFHRATATRILALQPRSILEIGCGTGALLRELAPHVERYVGVEPAADAASLARRGAPAHVRVADGDAETFAAALTEDERFDVVVLNSVAQYFPVADQLLGFVDRAAARLTSGGALLLGDMRPLQLQAAAALCFELPGAKDDTPAAELLRRVDARLRRDPELLVDWECWRQLAEQHPRLRSATIQPHEHPGDDELARFRVDVVLLADRVLPPPDAWAAARTAAAVEDLLTADPAVAITLPDARSTPWLVVLDELRSGAHVDARGVRAAVAAAQAALEGVPDIAALQRTAARRQLALRLEVSRPGELAAVFGARPAVADGAPRRPWHAQAFVAERRAWLSSPRRGLLAQVLPGLLREHVSARLPAALRPDVYAVVDELPRTANGKLLRRALPAPTRQSQAVGRAPATPRERQVAAAFAAVLGLDTPSATADFFALGGHSLLAVQVVAQLAARLQRPVAVRMLFSHPTVQGLAEALERTGGGAVDDGADQAGPPRPDADQDDRVMAVSRRAAGAPRRLLPAHERLWFLHRLQPGSAAYHLAGLVTIDGGVDASLVLAALAAVVERHELLGHRIEPDDPPHLAPARPGFEVDHGSLDAFVEAVPERTRRPFDLEREAPLRAWFHREADRTRLLLVLHHAAADGWSLAILGRDLASAAAALAAGRAPDWPPLPFAPSDYAALQHRRRDEPAGRRQLAWWRARLDGAPRVLELPADRRRPPLQSQRGGRLDVPIDAALWRAVDELARAHGATPFHVLAATFAIWLARLTARRDVVFGTVTAGRSAAGLTEQIGCFADLLPLRLEVALDAPFATLLAQAREAVLEALGRGAVPLAQLLQALEVPRDLSRPPLVQVTLELLDVPQPPAQLLGHACHVDEVITDTAKFDLSLRVLPGAAPRAQLDFATDLFDDATIAGWWRSFVTLLRHAVAAPDRPVGALSLLEPARRAELIALGKGAPAAAPRACLHEQVLAVAAAHPATTAVTWPGGACSFGELAARTDEVARRLRAAGLRPGQHVGIQRDRDQDLLPALLAAMSSGLVWVPLDPTDPPARRDAICAAAHVAFVIGRDRLPDVLDAPAPGADDEAHRSGLADPAYVLFTSGSTGVPKGVVVSHGALAQYLAHTAAAYLGAAPGTGAPVHTALTFDLTLTALFAPLLRGRAVHLAPAGRGIEPLAAVAARGPFGFVKLTPSHLRAWAAAGRAPLPVQTLIVGGEVVTAGDVRAWLAAGVTVVNEYGPTEATVGCTALHVVGDALPADDTAALSIGRPLPGVTMRILGDDRAPLPRGAIGELCVGGAGLALGYLDAAELTARQFVDDPLQPGSRLYRTGDRARWAPDGTLTFLGRRDEQVKVLGVRIEPAEVATALRGIAGVVDAAAGAVAGPHGTTQLGAWVVLRQGARREAVEQALAAALPAAMLPRFVVPVPELPVTAHGKLDLARLPAPTVATDAAPATAAVDARTATVRQHAAEVLAAPIGVHDDFFTHGGDSILALQLVARLRAAGLHVEVRDVFAHRTPVALAAVAVADAPPAAPHDPLAPAPLLPIHLAWIDRDLGRPGHDVQAVVCKLDPAIERRTIDGALAALTTAHPLLCARLDRSASVLRPGEGPAVRARSASPGDDGTAANANHDPDQGRMFAATLQRTDAASLLHLSVHHLVIDAVSWSTLLGDLDRAIGGATLLAGPAFGAFATQLHQLAIAGRFEPERDLWSAHTITSHDAWPAAVAPGSPATHPLELPAAGLQEQAARLGASTHELLVAALLFALRRVARGPVRIALERHGRDAAVGVDVAATIGWFTAVHPLLVPLSAFDDMAAALRATKEALRAIPDGGIGYGALRWLVDASRRGTVTTPGTDPPNNKPDDAPAGAPEDAPAEPQVLVNFLGAITPPTGRHLRATDRDPGALRAAENVPAHRLEFDLWLAGDRLCGRLRRAADVAPADAEALCVAFADALRSLGAVDWLQALHPTDHPLARLDTAQLHHLAAAGRPSELLPLTPTQQGMLVHALQQPTSLAYLEQLVHEVEGALDVDALSHALGQLHGRHALLRAAMAWRDLETPHWVVRDDVPLPFRSRDVRADPPAAAEQFLQRFVGADRRCGFDLDAAPLWRCTHVALPDARHALVFTYHHALLDGWSMPLLLGELATCYAAALERRAAELPPAWPYRDFVAWLQRQDLTAATEFWRRELAGVLRPTRLGIDRRARADRPPPPHDEAELWLSAASSAQLRAAASRGNTTGSALAQAALAWWLAEAGGDHDVVFGLTVAGRPADLPAATERIGLFINTVPVRIAVDLDAAARDLVRVVQRRHLELLPWHWTPLSLSQAQSEAPRGQPLFDVLLVYENYPLERAATATPPGLRSVRTWTNERTSYPLTVVVIPGERWLLRVLHAPDRIEPAAARRFLQQFARLLARLAQDDDAPLAAFDLAAPEERQRERLWRRGPPPPPPITLPQDLLAGAHPPASAAIVAGGARVTRGGLAARARAVAAELQRAGVGPRDLVAIDLPRGVELYAAILGTWHLQAAIVPLDPEWPERYRDALLARLLPRVVWRGTAQAASTVHAANTAQQDGTAQPDSTASPEASAGGDLAALLFTSGTTGEPKAVEIRRSALAGYAAAARARFALTPRDRVLQFAAPTFDTFFEELLPTLAAGATLVAREGDLDPRGLLRQCERDGVTVLDLPTAYFHALVDHLGATGSQLPGSVRLVIVGGEAALTGAAVAFLRRHEGTRLCNTYGPTEGTIVSTWCDVELDTLTAATAPATLPIGCPVPGAEVRVVNATGRLALPHAIGELWLAGEGLARGYRGDPAGTAARFVPAPDDPTSRCYRTGDLVRYADDGSLEFCGRRDRQTKARGHRVEPDAIESVLAEHPDIAAATVEVTIEAPGTPGQLLAFVASASTDLSPTAVREWLRRRLPTAAVPGRIEILAELPRTPHGKVDRRRLLRDTVAAPQEPATTAAAPGLLAAIQAAFAAVLGAAVSADDDFFALGGDSLAAIRVLDAIRGRADVDVSLAQLFTTPTPRGLCAMLRPATTPPAATARRATGADLREDAVLSAELAFAAAASAPRRVLLTGTTGFLGSRIARELLQRSDCEVTALVRRVTAAEADRPRLRQLVGHVDRRQFGLAAADYARLAAQTDTVIHVAANTNVWLPYAQLRADNVDGTRNVLTFCADSRAHLHHVSTIGVFDTPTLPADRAVDETSAIDGLHPTGGYAETKWVAEQLVWQAAARGLTVDIHRPGRLAAGRDGVLPERDLGLGLFTLGLELGAVPDLDFDVDLTPVDWAAAALVELVVRPPLPPTAGQPQVWHLMQQRPTRLTELWRLLDEVGVPLRRVPFWRWQQQATAFLQQDPQHPAHALLALLRTDARGAPALGGPRIGATRTHAALRARPLPPAVVTTSSLIALLQQRERRRDPTGHPLDR